jgi:integrase
MRKRLTFDNVANIPLPPKGHREYSDAGYRGLTLRVSATGRKTFIAYVRVGGKGHRLNVGRYDRHKPDCLKKARAAVQKLREDAVNGHAPGTVPLRTFKDLANEYVKTECTADKLARPGERINLIERALVPNWGHRLLTSFDRTDLTLLTDAKLAEGKPAAANTIYGTVQRLFNWLNGRTGVANPFKGQPWPAKKVKRDRVLQPDQLAGIWHACDRLDAPYGAYFKMLIVTGQRRGEVSQMKWSDIDLAKRTWVIPKGDTKSRREHLVPLNDLAVEVLQCQPRAGNYVFPGRFGGHMNSFSKAKTALDAMIGFEPWRTHDLRRSVATHLAAHCGVSEFHIARILNHQRAGTTAIYNRHEYENEKAEALQRWATHLRTIIEPAPENLIRVA